MVISASALVDLSVIRLKVGWLLLHNDETVEVEHIQNALSLLAKTNNRKAQFPQEEK